VSDHLGHITPVWSPDGKSFAFPWGDPSTRGFYLFPDFDGWLGNIWVATLATNAIQQITHIQGAVRRPVWSLDGTILTFYLHHNQFGATQLGDSQRLWQITDEGGGNGWRYGTLIYLP
jgi:Tol biopolymer transport system component